MTPAQTEEKIREILSRYRNYKDMSLEEASTAIAHLFSSSNKELLEEIEKLRGGYCTCSAVAHYKLYVEGDHIRHGDCGKLLSPTAHQALTAWRGSGK